MSEWFLGHVKPISDMSVFVLIDFANRNKPPRVEKAVYKAGGFYLIGNYSNVNAVPENPDAVAAWRKR